MKNLTEEIIRGHAKISCLDRKEEAGRIAGGRRNVEATLVAGSVAGTYQRRQGGTYQTLKRKRRHRTLNYE
jgi:hypothetical protein